MLFSISSHLLAIVLSFFPLLLVAFLIWPLGGGLMTSKVMMILLKNVFIRIFFILIWTSRNLFHVAFINGDVLCSLGLSYFIL